MLLSGIRLGISGEGIVGTCVPQARFTRIYLFNHLSHFVFTLRLSVFIDYFQTVFVYNPGGPGGRYFMGWMRPSPLDNPSRTASLKSKAPRKKCRWPGGYLQVSLH